MKAVIGISVDLASLFQQPLVKDLLEIAGEDAPIQPADFTRVTAFVGAPKGIDPESLENMDTYVFAAFKDPATGEKIRQFMLADGGMEVDLNGKKVIDPADFNLPPDYLIEVQSNYLVIASRRYMSSPSNQFASQGLVNAFKSMPKAPVRIAVDLDGARDILDQVSQIAKQNADLFTKPYVSLIDEVSYLTLSSDLANDQLLNITLAGHDEKEAKSIKLKMDALLGLAKQFASMAPLGEDQKSLTQALDALAAKQNGNAVNVLINKPEGFDQAVAAAINQARAAAKRTQDMNNFRQVTIAMQNYHDVNRGFPFTKHCEGEDANNGLSWAVHLLPYMEQNSLYDKFDLESSWNSEQNAPLANIKVPTLHLNSGGRIAFIRPQKVPKNLGSILDGTSNTACFVQDRSGGMTPWTKPTSLTPQQVMAQFKALKPGQSMIFGFYDGSVHVFSSTDDPADIEALLDPSDRKTPKNLFNRGRTGPPGGDGFDFDKKGPGGDFSPKGDEKKIDDPFAK